MKTAILTITAVFTIAILSSCEKCATCTTTSVDPQTAGETLTTEVCGTGKEYTDQVEVYETTDWTCTENAD